MADPQIELKALSEYTDRHEIWLLAMRLSELVAATRQRLLVDFPLVARRYANAVKAVEAIMQVQRNVVERRGALGAYVVLIDGEPMGVATFHQQVLDKRHGLSIRGLRWIGWNERIASGPMIAIWLGSVERQKGVLPEILRLGAANMAQHNASLSGRPWTLVRPDRSEVEDALRDENNGFGGFARVTPATKFSHVDGVSAPRVVYMARRDVTALG